jgi:two-component system chemotaxis sensor kinase CheA
LIRVADDGRGLDSEAVRARAVAKGLISADATLSESDTLALVMSPGFSTAARVTGISGRGVGMDVVRRSVDALRGTVEIASRPGEGTEVTLRLPLTLAIIDGLLVRVQTTHFVVPLSTVVECIELSAVERGKHRKHIVNVRGELIPYIPLRAHFGIAGDRPPIEQIMIVETRNGRCGFVVDEVLGNHQTVIKTLGRVYRSVQVISGATILGDGSVALILDPHRLVEAATSLATRPDHLRLLREEA